ncbi:F5/8 type C domain-containing protein [Pedobacter psychrotolerans]|uniref:DNA-binding protein n=1 Tax=Pedobacter psychrotolerans TaxID=1843235 RepID=A0A4R2H3P3_9SPHI|nr:glycosyl hydrolase [Pedobacter psychrotolerans]TCO19921.1 F5/8 type C domain-containing protein [Pedobacter psychrotolerans]GGE49855.1 DNA-binding protein [Pedobacter psychrotolerans]
MKPTFSKIFLFFLLCAFSFKLNAQQNENAKPWVFWYWVKGAVSKAGITADLEAMKTNGIGGAYLMSIQGPDKTPIYTPPVVQLTPEWWQMVEFAMNEAKRLGLKLGMHVSDGFALAGGPWITPELSMQKVVWSKISISSKVLKIILPQPEHKENYYRDIAVYAYPSPPGESITTRTVIPKITASNGADATGLVQPGNKKNFGSNEPCYVQYEFEKPFTCRTVTIKVSGNNYQAQRLAIKVSNDGKTYRSIGRLEAPRHGWQDTDEDVTHSIEPTTARFFRFIYDKKGAEPGAEDLDAAKWKPSLKLVNLEISSEARINQFEGKNGSVWRVSKRSTEQQITPELCVPLNKVINLTDKLNPDGTLNWKAPEGNWTILRVGHTSTGHTNATGGGGIGLECDKFNPEAVKLQFDSWYGEALKHGGQEIVQKVLSVFHVDSWECGSQNWSPVFKDEFLKRRGYDLTPYLPIMTGLPLESAKVSEDFLYDVRKTISDLVVDQFYKTLAGLAKAKGVTFTAESIAPTMMSDGLMHYKTVDVPMGEFWLNSPTHDKPNDMLDAISGAHIYGKNIIQAEAFTTVRMDWNESPGNMKTLQDRNYALGINKLVYHVFTHNPWIDRKPGMTLDGVGLYFQRNQTWWKQGKAWIEYAERTQNLLQQGKPVVDIAVFTGEELPRRSVLPDRLVETLPGIFGQDIVESEQKRLANVGEPLRQIPAGVTHSANMADPGNWVNPLRGYAYDSFNPDVLSTATVKNGDVVFESGATYKILVFTGALKLNPNHQYISYETVKKLADLIKAGAKVIIADKPLYQSGLKQVDQVIFDNLVEEIWGGNFDSFKSGGKPIYLKKLGLGHVFRAPFEGNDFTSLGLEKDLDIVEIPSVPSSTILPSRQITFAHRKDTSSDVYFISNQANQDREFNFSFRISGRIPQIYNAITNDTLALKSWSIKDGKTNFNLRLPANGSTLVIFKEKTNLTQLNLGANSSIFKRVLDISKNWQAKFDTNYAGPSKPVIFKELTDWTKNADSLVKYYSGTAVYTRNFSFKGNTNEKIWIDLGEFSSIAEVKINGIDCGTLWTAPHRLEISKAIKRGENEIIIEVTNTWANRLIGDGKLPENKRLTKTTAPFRLADKPLNPAGLLGPVVIQVEE